MRTASSISPLEGLPATLASCFLALPCVLGGRVYVYCLQSPIRSRGRLPVGLGSSTKIPVPYTPAFSLITSPKPPVAFPPFFFPFFPPFFTPSSSIPGPSFLPSFLPVLLPTLSPYFTPYFTPSSSIPGPAPLASPGAPPPSHPRGHARALAGEVYAGCAPSGIASPAAPWRCAH